MSHKDNNQSVGQALVITSGLSSWASSWLLWNEWPEIAARLTSFIATRGASDIDITLQRKTNDRAQLTVSLSRRVLPEPIPSATLISPSGSSTSVDLQPRSPGELQADLRLEDYGQYSLSIDSGSETIRYRFLNNPVYRASPDVPPIAQTWLDNGIIQLWRPEALRAYHHETDWRSWLIGLALLTLLLSLAHGRVDSS